MPAEDPPSPQPVPPASQPVPLDALRLDGSPRLAGEDELHARLLAEAGAVLPPILVHRETMQVLDGMHRVWAARLRGEASIEAVFFDGDQAAAFVKAVAANVAHGLPLSSADRRAAAERILASYPEWSDRSIAAATGLAAATVRTIRTRSTGDATQSTARVGRDGKRRPLDTSNERRHAAELIAQRPDASLREIARLAGVSAGTVRDVRRRLAEGADPVPPARLPRARTGPRVGHRVPGSGTPNGGNGAPQPGQDGDRGPAAILAGLRVDPALRYTERGRAVVRWLHEHLVESGDRFWIADSVPPHSAYRVAELAAGYARAWAEIADLLMACARAARPVGAGGHGGPGPNGTNGRAAAVRSPEPARVVGSVAAPTHRAG